MVCWSKIVTIKESFLNFLKKNKSYYFVLPRESFPREPCPRDCLFKKFIGVQLICSVVLVPGMQQSDLVIPIHISVFFFIFFSRIDRYKVLSRVPCAR